MRSGEVLTPAYGEGERKGNKEREREEEERKKENGKQGERERKKEGEIAAKVAVVSHSLSLLPSALSSFSPLSFFFFLSLATSEGFSINSACSSLDRALRARIVSLSVCLPK